MHSVPELLPTKVRGVVGGAVAFETTVDLGATFPNATWDESAVPAPCVRGATRSDQKIVGYELGCKLGERVEVRVIDKDGGLLGGSNLGDLDLGLVDDYVSTPLTPAAEYVGSWRLVPGGRCLALKTASYEDSVRYLPLTSATGGHGSAAASVRERRAGPSATGLLTPEGGLAAL